MKFLSTLAGLGLVWLATSNAVADQLDQFHDAPIDSQTSLYRIGAFKVAAQTFTVGVAGTLSKVELALFRSSEFPGEVAVDIAHVISGTPNFSESGKIATQHLPISAIPVADPAAPLAKTFVPIDFSSSSVEVSPGDNLAIVLRWSYLGANYIAWWENNSSDPSYAGGTFFTYDVIMQSSANIGGSVYDGQFRTYVTTTPEPGTCTLLSGCLIAIGLMRRNRRR